HAVALLHVLERRAGEVQEHPAFGSLDEQSSLCPASRSSPRRSSCGAPASRRRSPRELSKALAAESRGPAQSRSPRAAGRPLCPRARLAASWHFPPLRFRPPHWGSNARASNRRRAKRPKARGMRRDPRSDSAFLLGGSGGGVRSYRVNRSPPRELPALA